MIYGKSFDFLEIGIDSEANKSNITHVNPNCRVCYEDSSKADFVKRSPHNGN